MCRKDVEESVQKDVEERCREKMCRKMQREDVELKKEEDGQNDM